MVMDLARQGKIAFTSSVRKRLVERYDKVPQKFCQELLTNLGKAEFLKKVTLDDGKKCDVYRCSYPDADDSDESFWYVKFTIIEAMGLIFLLSCKIDGETRY